MAAPTPNEFKDLIPSATGGICDKFLNLVTGLAQASYNFVAFMFTEQGTATTEFQTFICAQACCDETSGTTNPNMPAPTGISASDSTYSNKVNVTWNAVTPPTGVDPVTQYKVYRATSDVTNPVLATLIATIAAPTTTYDDTSAVQGTTYNYWVTATNATETSSYGGPDVGNASVPTTTIPAISDLRVSKGFSALGGVPISLVWTAPAGATHYDIYRNTTNDPTTSTLIHANVIPDSTGVFTTASNPQCWDNEDEILLWDVPPSDTVVYYYWVVAKKNSPPAVSLKSNGDSGWVITQDGTYNGGSFVMLRGSTDTAGVEFTGTKIRVVLFGGGGGGAGGGTVYGAGAGGGSGVVFEAFTVAPGDVLTVVASPNTDNTGNAATTANGVAGSTMTFKINGVTKLTANGGGAGLYSPSGAGAGGASGSASGTTSPTVYAGHAGKAGAGSAGGKSGYKFGSRRMPGAHFNGYGGGSYDGNGTGLGQAGSGSVSNPSAPSLATGGYGQCGFAVVAFGT